MNVTQTSLTRHPLLPFALARTTSSEVRLPTVIALPFEREHEHPASLWRDSLKVGAGRFEHAEGWASLALGALVLPALFINQSVLWHLLNQGVLSRAIHAFLLAGSV